MKMSRYSVSERTFIVQSYYSNNNSPIVIQKKFATEFKFKTTGPSVSTMNSALYVGMLRNQFIPVIQSEPDFESMWFMQDDAPHYRTNEIFHLLEEHFNERIVALGCPKSKNMGIDWSPYPPDLNPSDSFLWSYIKDNVYIGNP